MQEILDITTKFRDSVPGRGRGESDGEKDSIYFVPIDERYAEEMHNYSVDPRFYEHFEFGVFDSIETTKEYIHKLRERIESGKAMYWFIRRQSDDALIGSAGLLSLNYDRRSIEWGFGIDPEYWGKGYFLRISEALKEYVFEELELNRLHGITMVTNERTISSVLAAGMIHEGVLRDFYRKNEKYVDGWIYSMLAKDYFEAKSSEGEHGRDVSIEQIIEVVQSKIPAETIDIESSMVDTGSWSSLSHMEIMVTISEKFGIQFSPADIAKAVSIKSIYEIINT